MGGFVLGFSGPSGAGKTTLIEGLIPILKRKGFSVCVIKHDGHEFEMDREGKDTFRFTKAGADEVMISSKTRSASLSQSPRTLEEMISRAKADIILVEGYKASDIPKVWVTSKRTGHARMPEGGGYAAIADDDLSGYEDGRNGAAAVADPSEYEKNDGLRLFLLDDPEKIGDWITEKMNEETANAETPDEETPDEETSNKDNLNKEIPEGEGLRTEKQLTHIDEEGNARMVDVSQKPVTIRTASAGAKVMLNKETFELIKKGNIKKGDVLTIAQIAGIMGSKRTPDLIPLCHPVITDKCEVSLKLNEKETCIDIESLVKCTGRTGVEMEAIVAAATAAMTVYDMCKALQRDIVISDIRLKSKTGGVHGDYFADPFSIAAAVLIGGQSKRMGSPKEKMIIKGDGRTFLHKICDEVDACFGDVISRRYLSVRKDQTGERKGYREVEDLKEDIGPLGGLISVLKAAKEDGCDAVLLLACDMISYRAEEIRRICRIYRGQDILWARTGGENIEPLASIYSVSILDEAIKQAQSGNYRLRILNERVKNTAFYDTAEPGAYENVNRLCSNDGE